MLLLAVCDDMPMECVNIAKQIRELLGQSGMEGVIKKYISGQELLDSKENFDIIFLDIEMNSVTGIEAAKFISENYGNTIIIFTTAHNQYVKEAFYVNAFQYMFKPIEFRDFKFELERAIDALKRRKHTYKITYNYEKTVLECSDIIYIETKDRHLSAKTVDNEYIYNGSIREAEKELSKYGFSRIEQGVLVNLNHVRRLDNSKVIMDNGEEKYISRRLYKTFLSEFNLFISGVGNEHNS